MLAEQPSSPETIDSIRVVPSHQQQHSFANHSADSCSEDSPTDNRLESTPRTPDGTTRRRSQKNRNSRYRDQQDRAAPNKDTSTDQAQGHPSRDCQRVPSLRSGSKRAIRLRQGEQQPPQQHSPCHHTSDECESLRVTLPRPRVTTTVARTTTCTGNRAAAGSASEQDEVEVRGLPSPGWKKRARVQNGFGDLLVGEALATAAATARATKSFQEEQSGNASGSGDDEDSAAESAAESEAESDDVSDELTFSQVDGHSEVMVVPSSSGAGSRRGSQTLYHYHHYHHHICSAHSAAASNIRGSHQTHTRNFSSPSLLDSFTSPDPMLSPIQSYFGSDPNSPASSFSLPRHDHYPRMAIDPSASMDGYHGFATHPWSEQSTIPSRALSHRWTRRLSQSDAYCNSSPA